MSVPRDLHLLFVGKAYGMRMALVRHLQKRGFKVSTFGSGWPGGFASHEESVKLFSRAEIVLGTGGVGMTDRVKHIKGRDFEVPMCGALYLTSYNPELADHFAIGSEILCYGSPDECVDLVYWVDAHPEEADRIRNLGRTRALLDHTWDKRLGQLFALFPNSGISGDL